MSELQTVTFNPEVHVLTTKKRIAELEATLESTRANENRLILLVDKLMAQVEAMKCCGNCRHQVSYGCAAGPCKRRFIDNPLDKWKARQG